MSNPLDMLELAMGNVMLIPMRIELEFMESLTTVPTERIELLKKQIKALEEKNKKALAEAKVDAMKAYKESQVQMRKCPGCGTLLRYGDVCLQCKSKGIVK